MKGAGNLIYTAGKKLSFQKSIKTFYCINKNDRMTNCVNNCLQGIIFPNGSVNIGVDVWRDLDKHDCSSHPVKRYASINDAMKDFHIVINHKNYN